MTERLRNNSDDLEALVGVTAEALGMPAVYVEKDFWVTEVLRAASVDRTVALSDGSTAPTTFTFKGGTSLSRVFGIVERFSEDVDLLAVFPAEATAGARHKVLKEVDQAVRSHLALSNPQVLIGSSTTGVKRYTTYLYPTGNSDPSLKGAFCSSSAVEGGYAAVGRAQVSLARRRARDQCAQGERGDVGGVRRLRCQCIGSGADPV